MRVFECKPSGLATIEHSFVRNSVYVLSSSEVTVSIYAVQDESELVSLSDTGTLFDLENALLLNENCVYNTVLKRYQYFLDLSSQEWHLGIYLIEWKATIDSNSITEFDKLYIVAATRDEIVEALEMPTSVNAGGVTVNYAERLSNLLSQRGVRVGRISKNRTPRGTGGANRDYDRTGRRYVD